jgi:hypothetical protein
VGIGLADGYLHAIAHLQTGCHGLGHLELNRFPVLHAQRHGTLLLIYLCDGSRDGILHTHHAGWR